MYILYGFRGSGSAAIEMGLRHCGAPYRVVRAASWEPDSATEALAKLNPLGQIPTLVLPGGTVLTESAAILIHLGLVHPETGLLPVDPERRAQAVRGLVFIAANCYAAIGVIDYPERWTTASAEPARLEVREAARRQLHRNWEICADTLTGAPYLTGAIPGALDYLAAVVSRWSGARTHLATARPAFRALLDRIDDHESVRHVLAEHFE